MIAPRAAKIRSILSEAGLQGLLISDLTNIRWASGFAGSNGALLVLQDSGHLFTDSRYSIQAAEQSPDCQLHIENTPVAVQAARFTAGSGLKIGFEADHLTFEDHEKLVEHAEGVELIPTSRIVQNLRYVKEPEEIKAISRAAQLTDEALEAVLPLMKRGMTEKQVARELQYLLLGIGAEALSFDSIVASGARSALAHATPTDSPIAEGNMLLLDYGAMWMGYAADITRTLHIGSPSEQFTRLYNLVLGAQTAAIDAIRPGVKGADVDGVARAIITDAGYGPNFGHSLGHSLGLSVHDGPALSVTSELVLQPGMVVTVEPGIYIEGWGGIRIEDDILVTEGGSSLLTYSPKTLRQIDMR